MSLPLREPPALHDRALQDLSYIRRTMEGASAFTDVPGWGLVLTGFTALGAATFASLQPSAGRWIALWLGEAVLAICIGGVFTLRKIRRRSLPAGTPLLSVPARKFLLGFWPAVVAGAVLTFALIDPSDLWSTTSQVPRVLPGLWLLLYGVGVVTAGAFSVRTVPLMGFAFMILGVAALLLPAVPGDLFLALGFGVLQIGCGFWIARRYGG